LLEADFDCAGIVRVNFGENDPGTALELGSDLSKLEYRVGARTTNRHVAASVFGIMRDLDLA
jgi:hypothetical protein